MMSDVSNGGRSTDQAMAVSVPLPVTKRFRAMPDFGTNVDPVLKHLA
jgi:hypothetical protein